MSDYSFKHEKPDEAFATGARREIKEGKGRFDLLSPVALRRIAAVHEKGARAYRDAPGGERNWEQGLPMHSCLDSALRHLTQYLHGERDEDHLAHAGWNIHAAMEIEERIQQGSLPESLLDVPGPEKWAPHGS